MTKQVISMAALTVRCLGYRIDISGYVASVVAPNGINIYKYTNGAGIYYDDKKEWYPSPTEMLGHWITRLHMEKHYGIKTPHYWENA